ncbi:MAG: hypothetical protein Q8K78_08645 [Planctomycetaceae bacterium]|nr:hypothetical protein [Planctomycetaceae bacterium]
MSNDRRQIVERYTSRHTPPSPPPGGGDDPPGDENSYQPAAPVSANRPPELMLELRFKKGDALALSYALLISAAFNPSQGIALEYTTHRVAVGGRNLRGVYRALVAHRLAYLQELSSPLDDQPDDATVISSLQITAI